MQADGEHEQQQQAAHGSPVGQQQLPTACKARQDATRTSYRYASQILHASSRLTCCLQAQERKEQRQRAQLREFLRAKNLALQSRTLGDPEFWQVEAGAEGSAGLGSPDGHPAACAPRRAEGEDDAAGAATFHSRKVFCLCLLNLLDCSQHMPQGTAAAAQEAS